MSLSAFTGVRVGSLDLSQYRVHLPPDDEQDQDLDEEEKRVEKDMAKNSYEGRRRLAEIEPHRHISQDFPIVGLSEGLNVSSVYKDMFPV